jgi:DNA-binding NtrC family response regulator
MSERVLLVDDEPEFLEAMAERMRTRGLNVTTAASAREALELVGKETFDAVILDLMMPGMDGLEAFKALRAGHEDAQVIFLTGHASVEKGIEAMKLGAMDFVEKPADLNQLLEKIRSAKAQKMILVEKKAQEKIKDILTERGW